MFQNIPEDIDANERLMTANLKIEFPPYIISPFGKFKFL